MKIEVAGGIAIMLACTVAANLLLKLGASAAPTERIVFGLFGWITLGGFVFFGISGVVYAVVLRWLPLNVAQALAAAQFVGTIVASAWILSEPISYLRWFGIALISAGILLVGLTASADLNGVADRDGKIELTAVPPRPK